MDKPTLSLVAGLAHGRVIGGQNGGVPWHLAADSQHWRGLIKGHVAIIGSATFAEFKPGELQSSTIIVVTSRPDMPAPPDGYVAHSIDEALALGRKHEPEEIFVIGGAGIFAETIKFADKLRLTYIDLDTPGTKFFPEYEQEFREVSRISGIENGIHYAFVELVRKVRL